MTDYALLVCSNQFGTETSPVV